MKKKSANLVLLIAILIVVNLIGSKIYTRVDLTEDKRYSISKTSENLLSQIDEIIQIKVYLQGDFPTEFKRLQTETRQLLEEFRNVNKNIQFRFINPAEIGQNLIDNGLTPSRLQVQEQEKFEELVIFPWAVIQYGNAIEKVSLLKDIYTNSQNEQLESSIQNLEYAFSSAIHNATIPKSKKIAVLKGNGELNDANMADFLITVNKYYHIAPFTLDSIERQPDKTLEELNQFDLIIVAKPTEKFNEKEKFVLDQFIMQGGNSLWLIDQVHAELDSLMQSGETLVYARDLGLTDFFFNYGIRINTDLVTDLYCAQIPLASGNVGNNTQFESYNWEYYPVLKALNNHPINTNIEAVRARFSNSLELLKTDSKKTVLLQSSSLSKTQGTPSLIALNSIATTPDKNSYSDGNQPIAVLVEGNFNSAYKNRVHPIKLKNAKMAVDQGAMVLIADGDLISNDLINGKPLPLGVDKWTNFEYGNKDFLMNTVNYLLDDKGVVALRSKKITLDFLDKKRAFEEALKWQLFNILIPLALLVLFGIFFQFYRRKKYS